MNSEQIESRFGSYRVKVLLQDTNSRLASLCSAHDGNDICRTLAVTRFVTPVPDSLVDADKLIRGPQHRQHAQTGGAHDRSRCGRRGHAPCGEGFAELARGQIGINELLHIRVYRLLAGPSDTAMVPYAIIAEAHHPEHIPPLPGMTPVSELTTDALDEDATLAMATLLSALKFATE